MQVFHPSKLLRTIQIPLRRQQANNYFYNPLKINKPLYYIKPRLNVCPAQFIPFANFIRTKKKKAQAIQVDDDDVETEQEDEDALNEDVFGKDSKDIVVNSFNLCTDTVLKMSNNMSKKKIDDYFLEGKIYLNGKVLTKKAYEVNPNDEIDIITGTNLENPEELVNVYRIFILTIKGEKNKIGQYILHVRRFKNLAVPKYQ